MDTPANVGRITTGNTVKTRSISPVPEAGGVTLSAAHVIVTLIKGLTLTAIRLQESAGARLTTTGRRAATAASPVIASLWELTLGPVMTRRDSASVKLVLLVDSATAVTTPLLRSLATDVK